MKLICSLFGTNVLGETIRILNSYCHIGSQEAQTQVNTIPLFTYITRLSWIAFASTTIAWWFRASFQWRASVLYGRTYRWLVAPDNQVGLGVGKIGRLEDEKNGRLDDWKIVRDLNIGTLELWNSGSFEHRNIGTLNFGSFEHRNIGTLEHWIIWTLEHWNIWTFEHLDVWTFGHLDIWTVEHSHIRTFENWNIVWALLLE